jgi:lysophospholipase L1-like esterase
MTSRKPDTARQRSGRYRPGCSPGWPAPFLLLVAIVLVIVTGCMQAARVETAQGNGRAAGRSESTHLTYVALGASDAFGIGSDHPYHDNWASDLLRMLDASRYHLVDLGVPDITIHDSLSLELPIAQDEHPVLITIWLGVNDIAAGVPAASYASDLDTLLSTLRVSSPHARIAIANVPDLTMLQHFSGFDQRALREQVQAYNTVIASRVQRYRLILVDLSQQSFNLQAHPEYISDDGLHPSDIGYQQLATLFYHALQDAQR